MFGDSVNFFAIVSCALSLAVLVPVVANDCVMTFLALPATNTSFTITSPREAEVHTIVTASMEEKEEWMNAINEQTTKWNKLHNQKVAYIFVCINLPQ